MALAYPAAVADAGTMAANDESARTRLARLRKTEEAADQHRREQEYAVGDQVMLSTRAAARYQKKLSSGSSAPSPSVELGAAHVTLDLPRDMLVYATRQRGSTQALRPERGGVAWSSAVQPVVCACRLKEDGCGSGRWRRSWAG